MYDRNAKSERILTKLSALNSEYICERTTKFCSRPTMHKEITSKYYCTIWQMVFEYDLEYTSNWTKTDSFTRNNDNTDVNIASILQHWAVMDKQRMRRMWA